MSCRGICRGLENNGRCDVPSEGAAGTDCNDCIGYEPPLYHWAALVILVACLVLLVRASLLLRRDALLQAR